VLLLRLRVSRSHPCADPYTPYCTLYTILYTLYSDAMSNRKLLVRILTTKGYVCREAADGQLALDVYKQMCTDLTPPYAVLMGKTLHIYTYYNKTLQIYPYLRIRPSQYILI
jgi:hypothetical protein